MDSPRAAAKPGTPVALARRGNTTRERLLEAAETLLADHSFGPALHRSAGLRRLSLNHVPHRFHAVVA